MEAFVLRRSESGNDLKKPSSSTPFEHIPQPWCVPCVGPSAKFWIFRKSASLIMKEETPVGAMYWCVLYTIHYHFSMQRRTIDDRKVMWPIHQCLVGGENIQPSNHSQSKLAAQHFRILFTKILIQEETQVPHISRPCPKWTITCKESETVGQRSNGQG